jgi:hypothetical protein
MRRALLSALILLVSPVFSHAQQTYDIVVYGGTAGGVAAAVQAARMGKSVVVIEPGRHLGGLTSGGPGATDIGNKGAIGGISREFYQRVLKYYARPEAWKQETREAYQSKRQKPGDDAMWTFEPHVAEEILRQMLAEVNVPVQLNQRLDLKGGVNRDGSRITSIIMESGQTYAGKMFVDASYEGDLMAKAGVSYTVGRESNSQYGETLNGVQLGSRSHQFKVAVDPYRTPGDPKSGVLPGVHSGSPGEHGQGDKRVQAYNFRMCLTDVPENRVPFPKPEGYDPLRYELSIRTILAGQWDGLGNPILMPNRKTDTNNNGAFSTDNIGMNYDYPDGDYATRERIWNEHITYQLGWMWFLANDPRVPERIRAEANRWGLAKDEFQDTNHWPHQLYVREARRMVSDYVMTQHNCQGREVAMDPVGLGAYGMDSHNTQRWIKDGNAINEGDVQVHGFAPYGVSYRSIVPTASECSNLFVPVCLSATHISYGSIRMEPVFMVLGQSSATAACQAIDAGVAVQSVDYGKLKERLQADRQILEWTGPRPHRGLGVKELPGLVVDDKDAVLVGDWTVSKTTGGFIGDHYIHDGDTAKGKKEARFTLPLKQAGRYEVLIAYTALDNRASNVPVTITTADGPKRATVNERKSPAGPGPFQSLGVYSFTTEKPAVITISTAGTDGYVIVDAVQLLPAAQ